MTESDPRGDGAAEAGLRGWRPMDEDARRQRPAEPSNGLRGFLRKLAALFSLDPRSSGR